MFRDFANKSPKVSTYGVTTAVSVIYLTQTASTVTTTTISISERVTTAPGGTITQVGPTVTNDGPTITQPPEYVTITAGGNNYYTVTGGTVTVISYVPLYPSSSSKSFTCRTYATNYYNGQQPVRRSVFDMDAPAVMDEYDRMPKPGAAPKP